MIEDRNGASDDRLSGGEDDDKEMMFRSRLPVSVREVCGKVSSSLMALQQFPQLCRARELMPG